MHTYRQENNRCCTTPSPPRAQACDCTKIFFQQNQQTKKKKKPVVTCECDKSKGDGPSAAAPAGCRCDERALGGFGVTVDLSSFFSDERRECWVWVSARRPVAWLRARLATRLRLACAPASLALLAPQGLLHPGDPLALLSPGDTIRVVPVQTVLFDDESRVCKHKLREKCIQCCDEPSPIADSDSESKLMYENYIEAVSRDNISCEEREVPCVKAPVCVTRAVVASPPTRGAACSAQLEEDRSPLRAVKQRALDLLNRYEQSLDSEQRDGPQSPRAAARASPARQRSPLPPDDVDSAESAPPRPARPRRRRVRRRPRLPASSPAPAPDAATDIPQTVTGLWCGTRRRARTRASCTPSLCERAPRKSQHYRHFASSKPRYTRC